MIDYIEKKDFYEKINKLLLKYGAQLIKHKTKVKYRFNDKEIVVNIEDPLYFCHIVQGESLETICCSNVKNVYRRFEHFLKENNVKEIGN